VPCTWLASTLQALCIGAIALGPAQPRNAEPRSTISEVSLPGGLRAALVAIGDGVAPDRAQFLAEFIRRTYGTRFGEHGDSREASLQSLLRALENGAGERASDTLPLPLTVRFWTDTVFGGRATEQTLVSAILRTRDPALLYYGLLSLDDDTRAWIGDQPELIAYVIAGHAAPLVMAAPGLRVTSSGVRLPGGSPAEAAWQALVGKRVNEPAAFVRALLDVDDGLLASFVGALGTLTPAQSSVALDPGPAGDRNGADAARRLYAIHKRLLGGRLAGHRVFTRPGFDPTLLITQLGAGGDGKPIVPGTRGLWKAVFSESDHVAGGGPERRSEASEWRDPPDFAWLAEQVFKGEQPEHRRRYDMVLFAARRLVKAKPDRVADAVEAIRASGTYPSLSNALERTGVADLATFAGAARRAASLSAIRDNERALRAMAQFQGALALVTRAALRGSLTPGAVGELVSSLSAVPVNDEGDYDGRLVCWLRDELPRQPPLAVSTDTDSAERVLEGAAGPLEREALRLLVGPPAIAPRFLAWEGARYRLDLPRAEAVRITRALGDASLPYLSSADTALRLAERLGQPGVPGEELRLRQQELVHVLPDEPSERDGPPGPLAQRPARDLMKALRVAAAAGDVRAAARLVPGLRLLADSLLARGLSELAYAVAQGTRDGLDISAAATAGRHDFGEPSLGRVAAWRLPSPGTDRGAAWRVKGSLLGLDVGLAQYSLVSLSTRPLARRPSLDDSDRRVFVEAVALVNPVSLTDGDQETIAAAMRRGRARLDAARTAAEASAVADSVGLSPLRQALLRWVVVHDAARRTAFLSPMELLWLGMDGATAGPLHSWGAPGGLRQGCLCLDIPDPRAWETLAGRESPGGLLASAFPDLNLRIAEHLSNLRMPAALLGPVLAAATLDFVNSVVSRGPDDRRGLVEFVVGLDSDRVEQYLALLTTDGPLVHVEDRPVAAGAAGPRGIKETLR
jgi:hypothetical protein